MKKMCSRKSLKRSFIGITLFLLILLAAPLAAAPNFIGNIIANSVPANFSSYWNQVTSENAGKWGSVESSRDQMNWGTVDTHYNYARGRGIPFKFHTLVWGSQQPSWMSSISQSEQLGEIIEWMQAVGQKYSADMIDIVNEPLHAKPSYRNALGGDGSTGWDWVIKAFELADQYCSGLRLINEYGIINDSGALRDYLEIVNLLKSRNLIDGIGIQCHQFNVDTLSTSAMQANLNSLAQTGLPIYVSELDITGDDYTQNQRYQEKFPILYNHSSVEGITLWGYIQGQTWKSNTHLVSSGNIGASERPAMQYLKQFLNGTPVTSTPTPITTTPTPYSGDGEITVRARGTMGGETLELEINGTAVESWTMSTSYQDFYAQGSGAVELHFTNDDNVDNGMDIQVDYLEYHGTIYQAEDQAINTAVYQDGSCGGSYSDMMHCNGYIQFNTGGTDPTPYTTPDPVDGIMGDVNADEEIDIIDALMTAQHYVGLDPEGFHPEVADVDCDDSITIVDALQIAQYYVGTISEFTCPTSSPTQEPSPTPTGGTGECVIPPMPSFNSLPSISELPDPFEFMDKTRMTRKDQWTCRRAEIAALLQKFDLGEKPPKPDSVSGSYSGGRINVSCTENGKTINFSCSISNPSSGSAPYPALIIIGNLSSTIYASGVANISFPCDTVASQINGGSDRGKGLFYDLYGSNHSAGALMGWAWGVSRLIDALEQTPSANIDTTRLAVTGCSRYGKGALVAGAFDERIALTIPQESGSGGAASWRVSEYLKNQGANIQELCHAMGEQPWFSRDIEGFCGNTSKMPTDRHELIAMCAPRAVFVVGNNIDWLGPQSVLTSCRAAHYVFEALGIPDNMGYSISGYHDHCQLPSSQRSEVNAFFDKFIKGQSANTNIQRDDNNAYFDKNRWAPWSVPNLQ